MSTTVDSKVLEMRFDNRQFERGVATSMSTLEKLKQKLNLSGAAKGMEDVGKAAKSIDMTPLGKGVEMVQAKFSALQVMGITALSNITNSAINTGKRISKALTIEPIRTGFQEYETQIGAIQTILANTESKGSNLQSVSRALDELNTYADKTIYNFTEMTKNIGTFTAAGVDLEKSVTSIKGIANLAAISGSTSQQASTAMYQLSQALAAGRVSLMDWNSVVNAGMGGEVFQNALKRTAKNMGKNVDAIIKKEGSFRESLTKGQWLTAEVLTETLTQLSGAYSEADLIAKGYTKNQAKDIVKLADTAVKAATEVKTFTQLWDTLKESAQSGWTQTWELIVGDFGEAKTLLTSISNTIGGVIQASADARNAILSEGLSSGWKQLLNKGIADEAGYIDAIKEVAKESGDAFNKIVSQSDDFGQALKKGLSEGVISSNTLSEAVYRLQGKMSSMSEEELKASGYTIQMVKDIETLSKGLKDGSISMDEFTDKIMKPSGRENIIAGLTKMVQLLTETVKPAKEAFKEIFPSITGKQLYNLTEQFKKFTDGLSLSEKTAKNIKSTFRGLFSIFDLTGKGISAVLRPIGNLLKSDGVGNVGDTLLETSAKIGDFFTNLNNSVETNTFFSFMENGLSNFSNTISDMLTSVSNGFEGFSSIIGTVSKNVFNFAGKIASGVSKVFSFISEHVSAGDIFAGLAGGGIFLSLKKFGDLFGKIKAVIDSIFPKDLKNRGGLKNGVCELLDGLKDSISSFSSSVKATTLITIATSIGILTASLRTLSTIKPGAIAKSIIPIGIMMSMLTHSLSSITKTLSKFNPKGLLQSSAVMITISIAVNKLTDAMASISKLKMGEIIKGLVGIAGAMLALSLSVKSINGVKIPIRTAISIVVIAESCKILSDAVTSFSKMSWEDSTRGLTAMGVALAELTGAISILQKFGGFGSILGATGILIAVQSLGNISENLKSMGSMSWEEIGKGLAAMGGALAEIGVVIGLLGKIVGFSSILAGGAILLTVQSLGDISENLKSMGTMSWEEIGKGVTAMGAALSEIGMVTGLLGGLAGFSSILASGAILIVVQGLSSISENLKSMGTMSWDEIGKGLVAMGSALAEIGIVTGLLGGLAGFSGILGGGAILLTVQGLSEIARSLEQMGTMSWEEIGKGVTAMGAALSEIGVVTGALGSLAGFSGILGGGAILLTVQGLSEIAGNLEQMGSMSWEEIGIGLTAMGVALAEIGVVTGALGSLAGLSAIIGGGAILVAVQGLSDIAEALNKFGQMSWEEIGKGLAAMGGALGELALGGFLNTLSILGSYSISAMAEPLGVLADSVKKWTNVQVPEGMAGQLSGLASGVSSFTLSGLGANAISEVAEPLGIMADSVRKWQGVTISEGLSTGLTSLATGVEAFNFAILGAKTMDVASESLGKLADGVSKWSNVTVPEGMQSKLEGLAKGVNAFSISFLGGWSMDAVGEPLGKLATSVQKWNNVTIPEGMQSKLEGLAKGVKAFGTAFFAGWSIDAVEGPLGKLASAVKKWNGVSVPEGLQSKLEGLAKAIKTFSDINSVNVTSACNSINKIITFTKSLSDINVSGAISQINSLVKSINSIKVNTSSFSNIGSQIVKSISSVIANNGSLKNSGVLIVRNISNGIISGKSVVISSVNSILTQSIAVLNSKTAEFQTIGSALMTRFISGIRSKNSSVASAATASLSSASRSMRNYYGSFYSAGQYVASGFSSGIRSKISSAASAAAALASSAASAARKNLQINSPSKVFRKIGSSVPEGFIQGISMFGRAVTNVSSKLGENAVKGIKRYSYDFDKLIPSLPNANPSIRPVLDLSEIKAGARSIDNLLSGNRNIGVDTNVNTVDSILRGQGQNGGSADVVSAINRLRKDIGSISGNTYNIDGITYDDGSNISSAVETLIRAVLMEGRA